QAEQQQYGDGNRQRAQARTRDVAVPLQEEGWNFDHAESNPRYPGKRLAARRRVQPTARGCSQSDAGNSAAGLLLTPCRRASEPKPPLTGDFPMQSAQTGHDVRTERLIEWLRDAHAMEAQAETMLKKQASRIEHYPKLKARIEQHIVETQNQSKLIEECLQRHDKSYSGLKDLGGKMMAMGQAMGGMMVSDEIVKGAQMGYVFENLEIASYKILIA